MRTDINRILRLDPRPIKYSAPMGDSGYFDAESDTRLYCQRVRFVDGDYGPDGTYWGFGRGENSLYCVFDIEDTCRKYYRAASSKAARELFCENYPDAEHRFTR